MNREQCEDLILKTVFESALVFAVQAARRLWEQERMIFSEVASIALSIFCVSGATEVLFYHEPLSNCQPKYKLFLAPLLTMLALTGIQQLEEQVPTASAASTYENLLPLFLSSCFVYYLDHWTASVPVAPVEPELPANMRFLVMPDKYSHLKCPISGVLIQDPVRIKDEDEVHVFERRFILKWLNSALRDMRTGEILWRNTNPCTNCELKNKASKELLPAADILQEIAEFKALAAERYNKPHCRLNPSRV